MERRDFLKQIAAGTGLLVSSKYCAAHIPQIALTGKDSAHAVSTMAVAGETFLKSLSPEKRELANLPFDNEQRQDWDYVPRARKGIPYKQLDREQIQLASALLHAGLSQQGFQNVSAIRSQRLVTYCYTSLVSIKIGVCTLPAIINGNATRRASCCRPHC